MLPACAVGRRFLSDSNELLDVMTNDFFVVEHEVSSLPVYGILRRLVDGSSRVCGGYEIASIVLCFPHPHRLLPCFLNF